MDKPSATPPILTDAALILGEAIPTDTDKAWDLLWRADKLRFRLIMEYGNTLEALYRRRMQVLIPKDGTVTDVDRTTLLAAGSASEEALKERLSLTLDLVNKRIDLLVEYIAYRPGVSDDETKEESNGHEEA